MTGWAKYLALQSQNPVCTAAEMKLLCPTASSASSAVCGEGTGLSPCRDRDTPRDTPSAPGRAPNTRTGQGTPRSRLWDQVAPWEGEHPSAAGSGLQQPHSTLGRFLGGVLSQDPQDVVWGAARRTQDQGGCGCVCHTAQDTPWEKGKAAPFPARLSEIPSRLLLPNPREGEVLLLLAPCGHSCPLSLRAAPGSGT